MLLLRDIPDATPQEEVEALFQGEGVPDVKGRVEYSMNNNWMIRFDNEADTACAYQFVINKTFNGKPIYVSSASVTAAILSHSSAISDIHCTDILLHLLMFTNLS